MPAVLPPIIGRDDDLEALAALGEARFITLVGLGGSGKTTLARAFMERTGDSERWFVDLSAIADTAGIGAEIAAAVGLATAGAGPPEAAAIAFLRGRSALLVLDNVEQMPGVGMWIESFLVATGSVRVLATSRFPTQGRGEHVLRLAGLGLPHEDTGAVVEASAAGALFLARARALGVLEEVDAAEAAAIADIVRRVDGLPLAIELAAGRSRLLSPASLQRHLDDPHVLARSASDPAARRDSLEVVLDWTFGLLSETERKLLGMLAIVPDTFDADLAWNLAPDVAVLDALDALLTAGLISVDREDPHRFRLLETIRRRAMREVSADLDDESRRRFAEHMSRRAGELAAEMWGGEHQERAAILFRAERTNLAAAIDWWIECQPAQGLRVFADLRRFWWTSPDAQRPTQQLRRLLDRAAPDDAARPGALATLMMLIDRDEGGLAALALEEEVRAALVLADSPSDRRACLTALSQAKFDAGDWRESGNLLREVAMALTDPTEGAQFDLSGQASIAVADGDLSAAAEHLEAAVQASIAARDDYNQSAHLFQLAVVQLSRGRLVAAREAAEAGHAIGAQATFGKDILAMCRARGHATDQAWTALRDGWYQAEHEVEWERLRMVDAAAVVLEESHRDAEATIAHALADRERAGRWWRWTPIALVLDRSRRTLRRRLGAAALALAARRTSDESVGTFMRAILAEPGAHRPARGGGREGLGELTPREVQVLALVGESRTDREIAQALGISTKTASVHVANIRGKLGAVSRLDAALHARAIGLAGPPDRADRLRPPPRAGGRI